VHHIWCPLFSQEFQDLPDGAETTLTFKVFFRLKDTTLMSLHNCSKVVLTYFLKMKIIRVALKMS
ncbi:hypothetical protein, partial [Escherichia coli]|uniref:hypothetical protein n=1 Tax=Escherichia coli TaxID=562 RepID=UPI001ADDCE9A